MEQSFKGKYGLGRVAFKAYFVEIHQEIEAGYPLTHIYDKRKDKLGITYSQFARYVGKYITRGVVTKPNAERSAKSEQSFNAKEKPPNYIPQLTPKKGLNDPMPLADSELF